MTSNPLPSSLYGSLLSKLTDILELTQQEGTVTPQAKQALVKATSEFKHALGEAKELALSIPGGELLVSDQDEIIEMLEQLRDRKRRQLAKFSELVLKSSSTATLDMKMEIDSMASTPFND